VKSNSTKRKGFGLLEIVISMMILSIISVSVYSGFIMIIKQTKAGQVKQQAALEGKKVIEEIQATSFEIPSSTNSTITIGDITLTKHLTTGSAVFYTERYLNERYETGNNITADNSKYTEKITVTPTKAKKTDGTEKTLGLNANYQSNVQANKFYISRVTSTDYINYSIYNPQSTYNPDIDSSKQTLSSKIESGVTKIELYVYLEPSTTNSVEENITIKDYKGQKVISTTQSISENLVINFSKYKESDGSLPNNVNIEINIYNKTSNTPNVYIEKQKDLNVNVESRKNGIKIYDNRAEDTGGEKIETLYDVKVEIINKDNDILFTGYSKKNIH
jgi:prepilin-type N-terminal cleavage/methylation domain-containing protein